MNFMDLKQYFTAEAVALRLKSLPELKTTVIDEFFTRKVNHPFDKVGKSDITSLGTPAPLIMRGAASLPVDHEKISVADYEPYEIANHDYLSAADMNALQHLEKMSVQARLAGIDDTLRRICRATAEGIAAKALTGKITWPVATGSGLATYEVDFGKTLTKDPAKKWDTKGLTLREVHNDLRVMQRNVHASGYGGKVKFWAGDSAFDALVELADGWLASGGRGMAVESKENALLVGSFEVRNISETYIDPETKKAVAKVDANSVMAFASDAVHTLFYCAIDDFKGQLKPLPYFSKPVEMSDPSGVKVIGRSKPFPVPVVKAVCWGKVL